MPAAAFAVHQLRFVLAFGGQTGAELQRSGHSYLHSLVPWLVMLIAVAAGGFLWLLGRAVAGQRSVPRYAVSVTGLWLACSAALVAIYVSQELLEGIFATGHAGGLAGVFAYGGWWSIPASLCIGLVLATVFHGARWVLDEIATRHQTRSARQVCRVAAVRPRTVALPRLAPLAGGWSGRGPPA